PSMMAPALAERGGKIELVRTKHADRPLETPDLAPRQHTLDMRRANELLGLSLKPNEAIEFLRKMRHDARAEGEVITASSPAYRLDLLHAVDLTEDIAIAWGYDRYPRGLPKRMTIGEALAADEFGETGRTHLIAYVYQEVMSLTIASAKEPVQTPPRVEVLSPLGGRLPTVR